MAKIITSKNRALRTYDYPFKVQPTNQFEIELFMFSLKWPENYSGQTRDLHFKNAMSMGYPWIYPNNWHDWNELCLWAWCNYDNIGMTGCGAAHKTFTFSLLAFIEFICSPHNTAVIMTSTTVPALKTRLWPRFKDLMHLTIPNGDGYVRAPLPFHVQESKTMIQAKEGDDEHSIRAVAVDKGMVEKALGKIIGNHPGRVVMVVDEAAQTEQAVFEAKNNLAIGTSYFRFVAIANAISQFDSHGKFCEPKNGWGTISVADEWWETKNGICLHFDGLKSPNVRLGEKRYPKLFGTEDIERIRKDAGEDSLAWWSQVRGFWPPTGISKTVLDAATIIAGKAKDKAVWQTGFRTICTLDPAFTTGGDRCILRFFKIGKYIDGIFGMELSELIEIRLDAGGNVPINYQIALRVKEECEKRKVTPGDFSGDSTAASGLFDIISQVWSPDIRRVPFGGKASERAIGFGDQRRACDVYANRVTELWFSFQKMVAAGRARGLDDATAAEFCTREYKLMGERLMLETKADMKKRTAGTSPDLADPVAIAADYFRDNAEKDSNQQAAVVDDWQKTAAQYDRLYQGGYKAA